MEEIQDLQVAGSATGGLTNMFSTLVDNYNFNYFLISCQIPLRCHNILCDLLTMENNTEYSKKISAPVTSAEKKRSLSAPEASLLYGFFMQ